MEFLDSNNQLSQSKCMQEIHYYNLVFHISYESRKEWKFFFLSFENKIMLSLYSGTINSKDLENYEHENTKNSQYK